MFLHTRVSDFLRHEDESTVGLFGGLGNFNLALTRQDMIQRLFTQQNCHCVAHKEHFSIEKVVDLIEVYKLIEILL